MAERRGVRSSSRRTTPAPQPPPKAPARRRATRSASRDIEASIEPAKPTRRSVRQASVDSVLSANEAEGRKASRARRKAQKEAIADLTVVEEIDTQIAIQDVSATSPKPSTQAVAPRRSLGAASEMSGTTAISSFTLVEAETLEPRFMLRHLPKLHQEALEFFDHLVPADGDMHDDIQRIMELQSTNSDFFADYHDFDQQLKSHLIHYRGDHQQYIRIRAVHAALFGSNRDTPAAETGLNLVLYQANLIVFAKDMTPADRADKNMVGALRELDNSFPSHFLPALILGARAAESVTGDSALLQETFELALELRTQLAILSLAQGSSDETFDPDAALDEVFFNPNSETTNQSGLVRGWNTFALGGDDSTLPEAFAHKVVARMTQIRQFFSTSEASLEQEGSVNLKDLGAAFPWVALILRLLAWVRARNKELVAAVQQQGGVPRILERVKAEMDHPTVAAEAHPFPQASPRKNRSSFGRNRRRSSGKFDPNAEVDPEVLSKLIAREGGARGHSPEATVLHEPHAEESELIVAGDELEFESPPQEEMDSRPHEDAEQAGENNTMEEVVAMPINQIPESSRPTQVSEPSHPSQALEASRPPQSTNDFVSLLKETRTLDKENRGTSLFERQANAQRVEFGDGFDDSQPTRDPSRSEQTAGPLEKGKEPQRSSPKKRKIIEVSDDEDDLVFETEHRSANVQRQRANAPKRVRIDPSSSSAPTSHQPRPRNDDEEFRPIEDIQPPENEDPYDLEAPPRSTFENIRALARANLIHRPRRTKNPWTVEEEEALITYMSDYPRQYSKILSVDRESRRKYFHDKENGQWVARRTQVDLKDKARVMAKNMIKSGAGLRPGFDGVITPAMERQLREDGWEW